VKVNCGAQFKICKCIDADEAGSVAAMRESRMSNITREWLQGLVNRGFDWRGIKNLLRLSNEDLEVVRSISMFSCLQVN
jgi:hypothetical protein